MRFLLYPFIFSLIFSYITTTSNASNKFSITIKPPGHKLAPTQIPYKSIHVKYTLPNRDDQWNIVAIEPFIELSNDDVQQMTVHLCQTKSNTYQRDSIWYDDETNCDSARSMLIYQWISYSPISTFRISDDLGFQLDKTKSIVLTIIYSEEQQSHNNQSGIILSISTLIPRFHVGTIFVGNKRRGIRFSCRSSNYPRLLYAVKPLFSKINNPWWLIYVIRNRNFGRKLIQPVSNSTIFFEQTKIDMELVSSDIFLTTGDYIIIECRQISGLNCKFLIYYTYQNIQYKYFDENDNICQNNNYPDLFKLIPTTTNQVSQPVSDMDGTTIFLLVCLLLFCIWISIIIGCVIMRRIRGLKNFRSEPIIPYSSQKTRPAFGSTPDQHQHKIAAEGDHIAQLDIEHMGLMN